MPAAAEISIQQKQQQERRQQIRNVKAKARRGNCSVKRDPEREREREWPQECLYTCLCVCVKRIFAYAEISALSEIAWLLIGRGEVGGGHATIRLGVWDRKCQTRKMGSFEKMVKEIEQPSRRASCIRVDNLSIIYACCRLQNNYLVNFIGFVYIKPYR